MWIYILFIKLNGLEQGYYPDPTIGIIIVHLENIEAGKLFGARHIFQARYLRSYITDEKSKRK